MLNNDENISFLQYSLQMYNLDNENVELTQGSRVLCVNNCADWNHPCLLGYTSPSLKTPEET